MEYVFFAVKIMQFVDRSYVLIAEIKMFFRNTNITTNTKVRLRRKRKS